MTNNLNPGEFALGSLTNATQTNYYSFAAESNARVNIALFSTNGPGRPRLELYDRDGLRVVNVGPTDVGTGFRAYEDNKRLTNSGTYTIHVSANNLSGTFGYQLSFIKLNGANQREPCDGEESIQPGQFTGGCIELPVDMDLYRFSAVSNDRVNIALLTTNGPGQPLL